MRAWAMALVLVAMPVKAAAIADRVVIDKSTRTLTVLAGGTELARFHVALGRNRGRKQWGFHGIRNGFGWIGRLHRLRDWTLGCVAVTDDEIEVLWRLVPDGTPVEIRA